MPYIYPSHVCRPQQHKNSLANTNHSVENRLTIQYIQLRLLDLSINLPGRARAREPGTEQLFEAEPHV